MAKYRLKNEEIFTAIQYTTPDSVKEIMDIIGTKGVNNSDDGLWIFRGDGDFKVYKGNYLLIKENGSVLMVTAEELESTFQKVSSESAETTSTNKTALQLLIDYMNENKLFTRNELKLIAFDEKITELLSKEKEQIINARKTAPLLADGDIASYNTEAEQYFKETYPIIVL